MKTRICNTCNSEKPIEAFNATPQKSSTGKLYTPIRKTCNQCKCKRTKERLKERFGSDGTRFYRDRTHIRQRYGITFEQAEQILQSQNGKCKICQSQISFFTKTYNNRACVDHCHTTKKVRGILCHYCNAGIGYLKDSPMLLQNSIVYLTEQVEVNPPIQPKSDI